MNNNLLQCIVLFGSCAVQCMETDKVDNFQNIPVKTATEKMELNCEQWNLLQDDSQTIKNMLADLPNHISEELDFSSLTANQVKSYLNWLHRQTQGLQENKKDAQILQTDSSFMDDLQLLKAAVFFESKKQNDLNKMLGEQILQTKNIQNILTNSSSQLNELEPYLQNLISKVVMTRNSENFCYLDNLNHHDLKIPAKLVSYDRTGQFIALVDDSNKLHLLERATKKFTELTKDPLLLPETHKKLQFSPQANNLVIWGLNKIYAWRSNGWKQFLSKEIEGESTPSDHVIFDENDSMYISLKNQILKLSAQGDKIKSMPMQNIEMLSGNDKDVIIACIQNETMPFCAKIMNTDLLVLREWQFNERISGSNSLLCNMDGSLLTELFETGKYNIFDLNNGSMRKKYEENVKYMNASFKDDNLLSYRIVDGKHLVFDDEVLKEPIRLENFCKYFSHYYGPIKKRRLTAGKNEYESILPALLPENFKLIVNNQKTKLLICFKNKYEVEGYDFDDTSKGIQKEKFSETRHDMLEFDLSKLRLYQVKENTSLMSILLAYAIVNEELPENCVISKSILQNARDELSPDFTELYLKNK